MAQLPTDQLGPAKQHREAWPSGNASGEAASCDVLGLGCVVYCWLVGHSMQAKTLFAIFKQKFNCSIMPRKIASPDIFEKLLLRSSLAGQFGPCKPTSVWQYLGGHDDFRKGQANDCRTR